MEAGGSGARQSSAFSTGNSGSYDTRRLPPKDSLDRYYRDGPSMATAALVNPSNSYHGHHAPFPPVHHSSTSGPSIAGMISPVEPRRRPDDNEPLHRQSLPSLSEVISGAKPSPFPPSQSASTVSGSIHSFPSTYSSGPARVFPEPPSSDKQSPRTLHLSTYSSRPEPLPPFSDSARPPFSSRPPPLMSPFPGPQPSPPIKPDPPRDSEAQALEQTGPYHHPTHHQHPPPVYHPHPSHLPPGQIPLPTYPASPRHNPGPPPPFDSQRPPAHPEDAEYAPARAQYDRTLNRALDAWSYTECLERICGSSRTIYHFGEQWSRVAAEQHSSQPIPDRLPTEQEVAEMVSNVEYLRSSLDALRHVIRQTNERARVAGKAKGYEEDDATMYEGMKPNGGYNIGEVKKRRGRAAPPGRCHSCNRIDTPEWRRGPDGARTLCNACGLHYAKLERKRQLEARSNRLKSPH